MKIEVELAEEGDQTAEALAKLESFQNYNLLAVQFRDLESVRRKPHEIQDGNMNSLRLTNSKESTLKSA